MDERSILAKELLQKACEFHERGEYQLAIDYFTLSIEAEPSAEAYTFRGWSLSKLGKIEEAITECKKAIDVDSHFGNPYNDIGAYLIELGNYLEAEQWFHQAIKAKRYEVRHFAYYNLGRVFERTGRWNEAKKVYRIAYSLDSSFTIAKTALTRIQAVLN